MPQKAKFKFSPDLLFIRRKLLKFTQTKVGQMMGVDKMTISKWERGVYEPPKRHLHKLAKILETKPERLVLRDLQQRARQLESK